LAIVAEITDWIDVSIKRDGLRTEFFSQVSDARTTLSHGGLSGAHLGFG
jgi:hypothetical protein